MADKRVTVDIIAEDKTGPGVRGASRGLDTVERKARQTSTAVEGAFDRTGRALERLGERANAWGRSGDSAGRQFAGRMLGALAGVAQGATAVGSAAARAIAGGLDAAGGHVKAAMVGVLGAGAAAAAPLVAATLVGAILGALGSGVIAAGIASAFSNPAVDAALNGRVTTAQQWMVDPRTGARTPGATTQTRDSSGLLTTAKRLREEFAQPFVQPTVDALRMLNDELERATPKAGELGDKFAPLVNRIAPALRDMARNAFPGIERALDASIPLLETMVELLPGLGTSIGRAFAMFAEAGPEAQVALRDVIKFIGFTIEVTASWIVMLAKMYNAAREAFGFAADAVRGFVRTSLDLLGFFIGGAARAFSWIPGIGPQLERAAAEFDRFAAKVNAALAGIQPVKTVTVRTQYIDSGRAPLQSDQRTGHSRGGAFATDGSWAARYAAGAAGVAFAAGAAFAVAAAGAVSRTGGPSEVSVTNRLYLDGRPFRAYTDRAVHESERRTAWRSRVGKR